MDLEQLKASVYQANMELNASGLVLFTFGNVSGIDRDGRRMVIKPSGVPYGDLSPDNMVCVGIDSGKVIDSDLNPCHPALKLKDFYLFSPSFFIRL